MDGPFITPNIMYLKQAGAEQLNVGMSLTNESLSGGMYYRSNFSNPDAILAVIGYEANGVRLGYSYDLTVSIWLWWSTRNICNITISLQRQKKKIKSD